MLIEGVDDLRFSILVNYCVYGNARQLIQQIGRVVRNSSQRKDTQRAFVLGSGTEQLERWWENYKQAEVKEEWNYFWFAKTLANFEINDIATLPLLFCYNS